MLNIDLRNKKAFIAGIGDDQGFGWAIAKALAEAGAEILVGTWVPIYKIFTQSLNAGKFDNSRKLSSGKLMEFAKIYPLDAAYDRPESVPLEIRENKRYKEFSLFTIQEVTEEIKKDFGNIDIFVHSLANAPEITKPLLETSRSGYLAAMNTSAYSYISLLSYLSQIMNPGSSALSLTYIAGEKAIPGYGGGMSSAKAALESDTKTLAWELGRKQGIRVNAISAGPYESRAAKAIGVGFVQEMTKYSEANAPIQSPLLGEEIGNAAAFLLSPLASGISGETLHVDKGLHAMGVAMQGIYK